MFFVSLSPNEQFLIKYIYIYHSEVGGKKRLLFRKDNKEINCNDEKTSHLRGNFCTSLAHSHTPIVKARFTGQGWILHGAPLLYRNSPVPPVQLLLVTSRIVVPFPALLLPRFSSLLFVSRIFSSLLGVCFTLLKKSPDHVSFSHTACSWCLLWESPSRQRDPSVWSIWTVIMT